MRLACITLLLLLVATAVRAQPARESYWGPIPAAADSSDSARAVFSDRPMPVPVGLVYWPVRILGEPLVLLSEGVSELVEYLDERKVIHGASRLLGPRTGPFGVVLGVQAGALAGFGAGLSLEHDAFFQPGNLFRVRGSATVNGDNRASLGLRIPFGAEEHVEFGTGYHRTWNARYFGTGPTSSAQDESYYGQDIFWAGTSLRKHVGAHVFAEGNLLYSSVGTGEPRDDAGPSISTVFAGDLPPGFGIHSYGVSLGLQLSHENDLAPGRPTRGGSRRVRVERYESADPHGGSFWGYRAELQQFLTLWHPYRVLALRAYGSWLDPAGSEVIPFQRLMINDSPDALRGYRSFRFRDRGLVALNAEYRFPLWTNESPGEAGIDLYPLADWGQVFSDPDQLHLDDLTFSYGIGLRLDTPRGFVARVEWARGEEENTFRLRTEQLFQFPKLGFLYGRDPVPAR